MKKDAILATNTSTISITRMAEAWPDPTRFIGMHFFLPVDRMQLVEVIRGKRTSDETVVTIVELAKRIKKTPIVVNDCAGFLVNRILLPYMTEALALLLEGASMDAIDKRRDEVRHAGRSDRAAGHGRARHLVLSPARCWPPPTAIGPSRSRCWTI